MKTTRTLLSIFFGLLFTGSWAQSPMDKGFRMLETGQFSQAADFFKTYLETDPDNPTARLCYGRGVGLSGQPQQAKQIFGELLQQYPENYEFALNMAEAYMWSHEYPTALTLYEELVRRDSASFAAALGLANAFSENKRYDEALEYVQKALLIQPRNSNALVSQKFMRLGKAAILRNEENYDAAIRLYDSILQESPKDSDALLNKAQALAGARRYQAARIVYEQLVGIKEQKITGLLGLSQVTHLEKKNDAALQWANQAVMYADSANYLKAQLGKADALGWNKRFNEAFGILDKLSVNYATSPELLSAYGRMNVWSKRFSEGAAYFQQLLALQPTSFDGNLGYADARHAQALDDAAFAYVRKTLSYYPNQPDALRFLERLYVAHDPSLSPYVYFSQDNGGNVSQNYSLKGTYDPTPRLRTSVIYSQRIAENRLIARDLQQRQSFQQMGGGVAYQLSAYLKAGGQLTFNQTNRYHRFLGEVFTEWKVGRFQGLEAKYQEEMQTFTPDLIERNLKLNNLILNYNLSLPSRVGVYSQLIRTYISDGNIRNLLFASLYYDFRQSPVFKAGVNYGLFGFLRQVPTVYFSPDIFRSYEVFAAAENLNEPEAKWLYQATAALGVQKISQESPQGIYRFDVKTGYRFTNRLWALAYFMRSNSAASSVQGFTYNEWGLKARWAIPVRNL